MALDPISGWNVVKGGEPDSGLFNVESLVIATRLFDITQASGNYHAFVPNFSGRILALLVQCVTATGNTVNSTATLRPRIATTAVTEGTQATIANTGDGTNPFTPVGNIFQGTRFSALNAFKAGQAIDIAYTVGSAFTSGLARLILVMEHGNRIS